MNNISTVSARSFTWKHGRALGEFSSIPAHLGDRFLMKGRTRTVEFVRFSELRDAEDELRAVCFKSSCGRFFATVLND